MLVALTDAAATDATRAGAKAAALARALTHGLPVLPGFVVTVDGVRDGPEARRSIVSAATALEAGRLIVRSSSTVEDGVNSSMAGVFTSIAGVEGDEQLFAAIEEVIASADRAAVRSSMAVLVQPQLDPVCGGVLFGVDPVSGRTDRMLLAAAGSPADIVSGTTEGARVVLTRSGRALERTGDRSLRLTRGLLRGLARLAHEAERVFGSPQDIEWALGGDSRLWLLQSRPVTRTAAPAEGAVFGPGTLGETFPAPLAPLEEDLWLPPLRDAIAAALVLAGRSRKRVARSTVALTVNGRVVCDLDLLGLRRPRRKMLAAIDPRPPARRLAASWRIGRMRAALPAAATSLLVEIDHALGRAPDPGEASADELIDVLTGWGGNLRRLHLQEVLAGMLLTSDAVAMTGAAAALRATVEGRALGLSDEEITAAAPVVLALSPPAIGPARPLPAVGDAPRAPSRSDPVAEAREGLRLRARWVQELQARAAREIGKRLAAEDRIENGDDVRWLHLLQIEAALQGAAAAVAPVPGWGRPLPEAFRLAADGSIVATDEGRGNGEGLGVAGGWAAGSVHNAPGDPRAGAVLVVPTLDPALAPWIGKVAAIISETGSALSHLAILAREAGVPMVVGMTNATQRFAHGIWLSVDGTAGRVEEAPEG